MRHTRIALLVGLSLLALIFGAWFGLAVGPYSESSAKNGANSRELADVSRFFEKELESPSASGTQKILDLRGEKYTVVNLWATWCTPCREEMPEFVAFRREFRASRGIEFVGVAIDRAEPVRKFLAEQSVDYPILLGDISAIELTKPLGNSKMALPFSYILNAQGGVIKTKLGKLTRDELLAISAK
jgi:thiol-disulfide isomerase/thioredoxin